MYKLVFLLFLLLLMSIPNSAKADNMSNSYYRLQWGNFNMVSGNASDATKKLGFTAGETAPGLYSGAEGTNYKVRAGFQYIHSIIPFRFSISSLFIDFGSLMPGEPITRTNFLTISNGSAHGYSVYAYEDHPLLNFPSGTDIPDTTCDNGSCTQTTSAEWSSLLTYGFGYRCDNVIGTDCSTDFQTPDKETYYKQFTDKEKAESETDTGAAVMAGTAANRVKKVQITYKANIPNTQAAGLYQNIITYIATPMF